MFKITVISEEYAFELHEDEKATYDFLETFKIAKREGKHAVFSFYCQNFEQQVVIGVEQINFVTYKPLEGKEDEA